jgi:hypothetical protein
MRAVIRERCALDGALFYQGALGYRRGRDRDALLAFQRDCLDALSGMRRLLAPVHAYVQRRVDAGVLAQLGAPRRPHDGATALAAGVPREPSRAGRHPEKIEPATPRL